MLSSTSILGVKITLSSKKEIISTIGDYLAQKKATKPLTIFTPNPEQIVEAQKNRTFRDILNSADVALPDGVGLAFASQIFNFQFSIFNEKQKLKYPIIKTVPGIDFMEELVALAAHKKYPVAFIGGSDGVAEKALVNLKQKYPGLTGWAETPKEFSVSSIMYHVSRSTSSGLARIKRKHVVRNMTPDTLTPDTLTPDTNEQSVYLKQLTKRITDSDVRLIFVGLGAPKQEYFIENAKSQIPNAKYPLIFMSVGGAFDIFAGKLPRAPQMFRDLHLEWLWRLIRQPQRIGRQVRLFKFIWLVLREKFVLK